MIKVRPASPPSLNVVIEDTSTGQSKEWPIWPNAGPLRTDLISVRIDIEGVMKITDIRGKKEKDLTPGVRATLVAKINVKPHAAFIGAENIIALPNSLVNR